MGTKNKKSQKKGAEPELDERLIEIRKDPRFLEMPKKSKKTVVDDRFKQMFADKGDFNTISKYDKYGKLIKKQDRSMHKFYDLEKNDSKKKEKPQKSDSEASEEQGSESSSQIEENEKSKNKFYDENGNFTWNEDDESSSSSDDDSEEEEESEEEGEEMWDNDADIPYGEALDEEGIGNRLALNKMDWDNVSALDLMAVFNSLAQGDVVVHKVEIYPSLFGLDRMKNDSLMGPPKEIFAQDENGALQQKLEDKKKKQKQKKKAAAKKKAEDENENASSSSSDE